MATLVQMRSKIRVLLDNDTTGAGSLTWSDAVIDDAIKLGQQQVVLALNGQRTIVSITNVSVNGTSMALPPSQKIINVFYNNGNVTVPLSRGTGSDRILAAPFTLGGALLVEYIAKNIFPATDADIVTYAGVDLQDDLADTYCAYWAASTLTTTLGEPNKMIQAMLPELMASLKLQTTPIVTLDMRVGRNQVMTQVAASYYYESGPSNTLITIYR